MGISAGIEHHTVVGAVGLLYGVDQLAFEVGLEITEPDGRIECFELPEKGFESPGAVDPGIAPPLQIEVRAVENQYLHIRIVCFVRRSGPRSAVRETKIVIIPGKFDTFVRQLRNND